MAKNRLTYTVHNPNTEEATVRCIVRILAELVARRVDKLLAPGAEDEKSGGQSK